MIRLSGTVTYPDGRRVEFEGGPREWVAWEQYALSKGLPTSSGDPHRAAGLTMTWFLAYRASTRGETTRPGFEAWLDTIDDVLDVRVVGADPTLAAPTLEPSSSSAPPAASIPPDSSNGVPPSSQPSPMY